MRRRHLKLAIASSACHISSCTYAYTQGIATGTLALYEHNKGISYNTYTAVISTLAAPLHRHAYNTTPHICRSTEISRIATTITFIVGGGQNCMTVRRLLCIQASPSPEQKLMMPPSSSRSANCKSWNRSQPLPLHELQMIWPMWRICCDHGAVWPGHYA